MVSEPEQSHSQPTPRPKTSDVVGTVILGLVGLVAIVMGLGYGFTAKNGQVGAGFLPVLTGSFIVLATAIELVRIFFFASSSPIEGTFMEQVEHVEEKAQAAIESAHRRSDADVLEEAGLDTFGRNRHERTIAVAKIFAIMLAALLLIPVLGLLISFGVMTLTLLLYVERKPVLPSVLATAGALTFFYFAFVQGLRVPLPTGMLGII